MLDGTASDAGRIDRHTGRDGCLMAGRSHFGAVRRLPSGRYQGSYWHNGTRHVAEHTFPAKADAHAWLAEVQTSIRRGAWVDPAGGRMTVADLAARWLEHDPTKRDTSRARDEIILRRHVLPRIGDARLTSVTPADVQALVKAWASTKAASTVSRQYSAVRALFSYAVAADLLVRSPCRGIRLPKVHLVDRPTLDADDLDALATALGPEQAAMMYLGAVAGLRWAECAGLTVGSLDLLKHRVVVSAQLRRDGTLGPPKSDAGTRTLGIPAWLTEHLAGVLAQRDLSAADRSALVFVAPGGGPLNYHHWRTRTWLPATKAAGLTGLRFHDLRAMAATVLVAAGVDVKTAQTRMGHSSPALTLAVYARATEQADLDAVAKVGGFFDPSRTQRARGGHPMADDR